MKKRIFYSICLVAIVVLLAALTIIMGVLYDYFAVIQNDQLKIETSLAAHGVEKSGMDYLNDLSVSETRVTLISPSGEVLFDNMFDVSTLNNHSDREEVREALEHGVGESSRYSSSLISIQCYVAQKLDDGTVLRLGTSEKTVLTLIFGMLQPTLIVLIGAVLLALLLASAVSRKIVKPINELDLENLPTKGEYEEIRPLLRRLSAQQVNLRKKEIELKRKQEEFKTATDNMSEGILLIGEKRTILSMNRAASDILEKPQSTIGLDICSLDPSLGIELLLEETDRSQHVEKVFTKNNLTYRMMANPIVSEGQTVGYAILLLNITEKENAEKMRREFTANVSHELKTPLHSISGCAELLYHGMVQPNDIPMFAGQIYSESGRMISLIDDIIKLSHLDEGVMTENRTEVDLYLLAESVLNDLESNASDTSVTLSLHGESALVYGIPTLLSAIVTNLCSNAIKYNRPNGTVSVSVKSDQHDTILTVQDSGIGIADEHKERIFERFFRVDKSHSKELGGTGLGLSIVKHAAALHSAEINLWSKIGVGTTVTVRFPKDTH